MTEKEFREKMKEEGWSDNIIDEILADYHNDQKQGMALPLEKFWPIVPKPTIYEIRPEIENQ